MEQFASPSAGGAAAAPLDLSPEGPEEMAQPSPHFAGVGTGGKAVT